MIYQIHHRLEYRYTCPVYLNSHLLHLLPRTDCGQRLEHFSLSIDPLPKKLTEITDALGNPAHEAWFEGLTDRLLLEATSHVEVTRSNPFGFLLREGALHMPIAYSQSVRALLEPYFDKGQSESSVSDFATSVASQTGGQTIPFLSAMCAEVYRRIRHARREGEPWSAGKILAEGTGACRDVAILFVACCRSQGFATRFTSGYLQEAAPTPQEPDELHAWAEIYLEGAGWIGYDPTEGLAVGNRHVAVASGHDIVAATPVCGTYRSNTAVAALNTKISILPLGMDRRREDGAPLQSTC